MTPRVTMTAQGGRVFVRPVGRLDTPTFQRYLGVVRPAASRFDDERRAHELPLGKAPALALELERAGFTVAANGVGPLVEVERGRAERQTEDEVTARIAELASRGNIVRPFQETGARMLASRDRFILGDPMGVGKTWQAAVALPPRPRVLVICPATVKGNWLDELRNLRPDLFVQVLSGAGSFRYPMTGSAVILNYDILPDSPGMAPSGVIAIVDEAHYVKSARATRTKRLTAILSSVFRSGGRAWALTGTPIENHPRELKTLLKIFGLFEEAFDDEATFARLFHLTRRKAFIGEHPEDAWDWSNPDPEVALRLRRVSLRRRLEEVLPELPGVTYRDVTVELPGDVRRICDEALAALKARGINLDAVEDLVRMTQPGVAFELLSRAYAAIATAKIPAMEELIAGYEAQDEPLVVFSVHRGPIDAAGARPGWKTISGDVNAETRTQTVKDFQAGSLKGVAITTQAGGVGITLTRSAHALMVDSWWNASKDDQAIARLRRLGQSRWILVTRIVAAHPIDWKILALQAMKKGLTDATVEASAVGAVKHPDRFDEKTMSTIPQMDTQGSLFGG